MQVLNDGVYFISFKGHESKHISVCDESLNDNSIFTNKISLKEINQLFVIKYNSVNVNYTIMSLFSHQFLGIKTKKDSDYTFSTIIHHKLTDSYLMEWNIESVEYGYFTLELKNTKMQLEYNDQTNIIQLNKKSNNDNQKVLIKPLQIMNNGFYTITPIFDSNLALTFSEKNNEKKLILMPNNQTKNQFFWVQFDTNDGCYIMIEAENDNCLSTDTNSSQKDFISQSHFFNTDGQKWIISPFKDEKNNFYIDNKSNLLRLGAPENCENILQLNFGNQKVTQNNRQLFQFQKVDFNDEKRKEAIISLIEKAVNSKTLKWSSEIKNDTIINSQSIEKIELPLSISEISEKAFVKCTNIKTISCDPKWLKLLPNPLNVENIFVPQGIEKIEGDFFDNFRNLKFLSLPSSFKTIDSKSLSNLYDIKIFEGDPKFLMYINKKSLIKVIVPEYVVDIPEEIFAGCKYLRKVVFKGNSNLKTIQSRAFENCESLETFSIPESVNCISSDAFYGCYKQELQIKFADEKQKYSMVDNLIIDQKVTKITKDYEVFCNIESLEIPLTIVEFEDDVLKSFKKLKYIKCNPNLLNFFEPSTIRIVFIPDGIKQILKKDFDHLINLKFVEIPETVDNIEENSFESCQNLTTIKCGTKHLRFLNQNKIKKLILNNEVKQLNRSDFDELINLENCELPELIKITENDVFINCKKLMKTNNIFAQSLINNKIIINDEVTSIFKQQFIGWTNLKFLEFPKSVSNIENGTFDDCKNLEILNCNPKWFSLIHKNTIKELIIPNYVTEINKEHFDGFYSLTKIELPNDIKINDPNIFDSCESLKSIKCNSSVFESLSEKTQKRCFVHKKVEYLKPNYIITFSKENDQNLIDKPKETSIDDLAEFDTNNNKYCHPIMNVRGFTYSGKIPKNYKPENSDLSEISKVCGAVCHEIFAKFNIIPKTSQFLAILRLADEILNNNSHGSICEIQSGEGKTFIITVLSIILFKYNKRVDIAISNIELAKRIQKDQELYFNLFEIKTRILFNEDKNSVKYNSEVFEFSIVYSTLENFEYVYLNSLFTIESKKHVFDVILIDEIDQMFYGEFDSPLTVTNEINYAFSRDIYEIVFLLHCWKTTEIIKVLNYYFNNAGIFEEENIQKLKDTALLVIKLNKKVDYLINENDQIFIINKSIEFNEHIYKMIEIKENLETKPSLITSMQIDHRSYLNFYNKIAGVTGSIEDEDDEEQLKKEYKINFFKVLPHISSQLKVTTKNRPLKLKELYDSIINEIMEEREKGRPVLVIFDSVHHVDDFMKSKSFLLAQRICNEYSDLDNSAIENIGNEQVVTIATIDAICGVDIKISSKVLEVGGLHLIVPTKLPNQRMIKQAAGRTGRQGQPGSVTFYISENDKFMKVKESSKGNENLTKIEIDFANYIKDNFSWILSSSKNEFDFSNNVYPYAASPSFILDIFVRQIFLKIKTYKSNEQFQNLILKMIQLSWSVFFTNLKNGFNNDWNYCKEKYHNFIKDLNVWLNPDNCKSIKDFFDYIESNFSNEKNFDYFIFKGIKIDAFNINIILPEKAPQTELMNGISLFDGEEIYHKLQNGSLINWYQILIQFCDFPLTNIVGEKLMPKSKNIDNKNSIDNFENDEEEDYEDEIVTLKCEQKDTWEWIFYNIKDKKEKKSKKLTKSTIIPSFLTIEFIRKALDLSGDAYNGTFSTGKIIFSSEENDLFKPVFYCLEESNDLYVITRGSFSEKDWITDFDCKEIKCEINGTIYYFHQGFYNSAIYVLNSITSLIEKNYDTIFFIGHSYGASVSALLCFLTKSQTKFKDKNIFALAFGSAPSMSSCPPEIENCIFTFINGDDLIPSFCLFNILNTAAKNHLSFQLFVKLCLLILKPLDNKWIKELVYAIEQNFEIITEVIGILNVKKVKGIVFKIGENKKKKLCDCVIDESQLPKSLSISFSSLFNHFINEYEKSFKVIQT